MAWRSGGIIELPLTGSTTVQFFGQPAVMDDHSQFLKFFLPLFGFTEKRNQPKDSFYALS